MFALYYTNTKRIINPNVSRYGNIINHILLHRRVYVIRSGCGSVYGITVVVSETDKDADVDGVTWLDN